MLITHVSIRRARPMFALLLRDAGYEISTGVACRSFFAKRVGSFPDKDAPGISALLPRQQRESSDFVKGLIL